MKIYVFTLLLMATVAIAVPIEDEGEWISLDLLEMENKDESSKLLLAPAKEHDRERREITCDVLSKPINHTVCAFRCFLKGRKGGQCNEDGECKCRRWFG